MCGVCGNIQVNLLGPHTLLPSTAGHQVLLPTDGRTTCVAVALRMFQSRPQRPAPKEVLVCIVDELHDCSSATRQGELKFAYLECESCTRHSGLIDGDHLSFPDVSTNFQAILERTDRPKPWAGPMTTTFWWWAPPRAHHVTLAVSYIYNMTYFKGHCKPLPVRRPMLLP